ncbi:MAG: septum formation initiator family protein [Lachnospiraceae bacterium]|nr:septum formation initiator family protein [Lachnospiraceae bacterium]
MGKNKYLDSGFAVPRAAMYRKKRQSKMPVVGIMFVVAMLITVIVIDAMSLKEKQRSLEDRKQSLGIQITAEEKRSEDLVEFEKFTKTKKYAEEVAKEKLGLVHEDEIIFKPEK